MIYAVVDHTFQTDPHEIHRVITAMNRQLREHFTPYWGIDVEVRLEGRLSEDPDIRLAAVNARGDGILYLEDDFDPQHDPSGVHLANFHGVPYGFVFTEKARQRGLEWSIVLSHEVLELVVNPHVNRFALGTNPQNPNHFAMHAFEVCDAVNDDAYEIDGVLVSNFVLPAYFSLEHEPGGRNDFLGTVGADGRKLAQFNVSPRGYISYKAYPSDPGFSRCCVQR